MLDYNTKMEFMLLSFTPTHWLVVVKKYSFGASAIVLGHVTAKLFLFL
jgi:hypothetical protein